MHDTGTTSALQTDPGIGLSQEGLPLALVRARESVMAHYRHRLRRYDLTEPQWRVLKALAEAEPVELSIVARRTALLMPSLSRIVRDLEQRGYVTKQPDDHDLRRTLPTLTERGRRLVALAGPDCDAVGAAIRNAMGSVKLRRLENLLAELEQRAASLQMKGPVSPVLDLASCPIAPPRPRGRPRKRATQVECDEAACSESFEK
jgi:homoprotocatechuate degradation regulator HpaR